MKLRPAQLLSVRLFLLIALLLFCSFAIYVHLNYAVHRAHLERRVVENAVQAADLIQRSTRHGMLLNRRTDVDEIISAIGEQPNVEAVRVFNKRGEVVVSTEPGDVGHTVDEEAEACSICHAGDDRRAVISSAERTREFLAPDGHRVLGLINPIPNEPECSSAECHAHPADQRVLGVLDVQMSLAQADADLEESRAEMVWDGVLVSLMTALAAGLFIFVVVHIPVRKLIAGTRAIANRQLDVKVAIRSSDEIGALARSFERMATELGRAQAENAEWAATLEAKVEEKTRELKRAQAHLIQVEKMASLGKLSAIVAHEINNPLAGVLTYTRLVSKRLERGDLDPATLTRLREHLDVIASETRRCGDIVKNMLLFSRRRLPGRAEVRLGKVIDGAVRLVKHSLDMRQIQVVAEYEAEHDDMVCDADQIQQLLIALFVNASEAMAEGGTLRVALDTSGRDHVLLTVQDTGAGIPDDVLPRIYEPFFTTKQAGNGVGLGLAVVHGIVESHGGRICVDSRPGEGTTFDIRLPRKPQPEPDEERNGEPT